MFEQIDGSAKCTALLSLAQWIAIEHSKTRTQLGEYIEGAQELDNYLHTIGYRLVDEPLQEVK